MPTSTVENYLKQLYLENERLGGGLVPTGAIAAALKVTPGTATVMIKTLAESGLVDYEPRSGARLTAQGQQLALHVVRRHRLVELFLVRVLGLDWSQVHEEADVLEHAISERVLERIDEHLGRPAFDPHGDPIPTAAGIIAQSPAQTLADCDPGATVRVARLDDRDPEFLRYAEEHGLSLGMRLYILGRDRQADSVTAKPEHGQALTLGTTAARRVFVAT